jgi:hypothetical protein
MRALVIALTCVGCAHVPVTAQPVALANHADELTTTGHARVEVEQGGTQLVTADDVVSVVLPGHQKSHLWGLVKTGRPDESVTLTVRNLVAGCPDCLATRATGHVDLGTRREIAPTYLAIGAFGAAAMVASFTCLAVCSNVGGWAYVGTGIATATFVVPLSTAF